MKRLSRRSVLHMAGAGALGAFAAPALVGCAGGPAPRWSKGDPFSLGVAAGEPASDGFILWTRLAPEPQSLDPATPGGMTGGPVTVEYEIATDPALRDIVRRGTAVAEPDYAYSVHAEVNGLAPGRPYWYRFTSGGAASRTGRAMTAPAAGAALDRLRFAFVSCANYEHGYFAAYRHLTDEQPDLVLFLGDYIYEYVDMRPAVVRRHSEGIDCVTLSSYRNRYAQYRLDPDLQRLHAEIPCLMTWDDHEVQNDYAADLSPSFMPRELFLARRAAAYRAFYEHMPVRPGRSRPNGPDMRVYDRFAFGDLVEISILDGREYRSAEACYGPPPRHGGFHLETNQSCPERLDPSRTMLGMEQEAWLFDGLSRSHARWNVIGQDVLMAQFRQKRPGDTLPAFSTDDWNGYPASRDRLLRHITANRVRNVVVAGGDIHSFFVNDLKENFDDERSPVIATEFVGTSIASWGPPYDRLAAALPDNPHVHFFDSRQRGYVMVDATPARMSVRLQSVGDAANPNAPLATLRSYVVEDGRPGALPA
ncbi:MAG TPA: alkaline phosphatase D family protein [Alphaproteobacteria bacterium]|nr:alkaline phosphatase D family protein [Alphaproteobacteria bacterium]